MGIKEFLETELLPSYNPNNHTFNASLQEEFMEPNTPFLDKNYIALLLKANMSHKSFKSLCHAVFGTDRFNWCPTPEEDITQELFNQYYEFGKFTHGRQWVTFFAKQKIFVKRSTILGYIYEAK